MEYENVVPIGIVLYVHFYEYADNTHKEKKFVIESD